jgi:TonB family protein
MLTMLKNAILVILAATTILSLSSCSSPDTVGNSTDMKAVAGVEQTGSITFEPVDPRTASYDSELIKAIIEKWRESTPKPPRTGKVVVQFNLNRDGTISDIKTVMNNLGPMYGKACEQAIESVNLPPWPPEVVNVVKEASRKITFTFYYY